MMWRLAWRDVRAHFTRFLLTILAVVIGVTFFAGTLALRDQLATTMGQALASDVAGDIHVRGIEPYKNGPRPEIPLSLLDTVRDVDGVTLATAVREVSINVLDADGNPTSPSTSTQVLVSGVSEHEPWTFEGNAPTGDAEIAVESSALSNLGRKVGDEIAFLVGEDEHRATVTAVARAREDVRSRTVILADDALTRELDATPDTVTDITVTAKDGVDLEALRDSIATAVGTDVDVATSATIIDANNNDVNSGLGFVATLLIVFIVIALAVTSFIIANTFHMTIRARQREFALLRALGASPLAVFATVTIQATLIGIIGSLIGLLCASGLLAAITTLMRLFGMAGDTMWVVPPVIAAASMVVGIGVTVIGAIIPAKDAASTAPVEAIRGVSGVRERSLIRRTIIGVVLLVVGVTALVCGAKQWGSQPGVILSVGAASTCVAVFLLAPALVTPLAALLAWSARGLGAIGIHATAWRLGVGNIVRNPRRTAATGSALLIGVALVTAATVLASSATASTSELLTNEWKADLSVMTLSPQQAEITDDVVTAIRDTDGVESVRTYDMALTVMSAEGNDSSTETSENVTPTMTVLMSMRPEDIDRDFILPLSAGSIDALERGEIVLPRRSAEYMNVSVGDTIRILGGPETIGATDNANNSPGASTNATNSTAVPSPREPVSLRVGAIHDSRTVGTPLVSPTVLESTGGTSMGCLMVGVSVNDGTNLTDVKKAVRHSIDNVPGLTHPQFLIVGDITDMEMFIGTIIDTVLRIITTLVALSIVVATIGVINTLTLAVTERVREIGLLRAVGLSRLSLARSIMWESIITAIFGTILGIGLGLALSTALVHYLADNGISTLALPWTTLGWLVLGTIMVGVLAAIPPTIHALRYRVLDAIASE